MAMLVEAPAAVEDALASLLDHANPLVQRRALATYARRLYYPFLLHEPQLQPVEGLGALVAGERRPWPCTHNVADAAPWAGRADLPALLPSPVRPACCSWPVHSKMLRHLDPFHRHNNACPVQCGRTPTPRWRPRR